MATFSLNLSSPWMLTSKTSILPIYKLSNKPMYLTKSRFTKKCSSYGYTITKCYHNESLAWRNGLQVESMPKHVAMLMEGLKRSGKEEDLSHEVGYRIGQLSLMDIARICFELGIKVLSFYTLYQPNEEVDYSFNTRIWDLEELSRNDIRVSVIGDRNAVPQSLVEVIRQVEETTANNKSLHIIEAVDYNGRSDIVQACIALAEKVKDGLIQPLEIDENIFQQELETKCLEFPNPDLMIRTGGKHNVGNFMLWQSAYSELYFVDKDIFMFKETDFIEALDVYQKRNRRFGGSDIIKKLI